MSEKQLKGCVWTQTEILEHNLGSVWNCSSCNMVEVHAGPAMPYKYCPYCAAKIIKFYKLDEVKPQNDIEVSKGFKIELLRLMGLFSGSFINSSHDLILVRETNTFFSLKDVHSVIDLRCKVIAWLSREACKSEPYNTDNDNKAYQLQIRRAINKFLGVNFNQEEWLNIYNYFGNECNRELCKKFIDCNYNMELIQD